MPLFTTELRTPPLGPRRPRTPPVRPGRVREGATPGSVLGLAILLLGAVPPLANAQPVNQPFDANGNGTTERVIVDGDYDGDGHVEPEDIQQAIHGVANRFPNEDGMVVVRSGTYVEVCRGPGDPGGYCAGDPYLACDPAAGTADCTAAGLSGGDSLCHSISCEAWDTRPYAGTGQPRGKKEGLINLGSSDSQLTLHCEPGVTIRGTPNKRRFDGTSPSGANSALGKLAAITLSILGTNDVTVSGCGIEGGAPRGLGAYDPTQTDWPLAAEGGTATTLVDAGGGWRDGEWNRWWLLLRPGCTGAGAPYAWCSAPEEFVQIDDTLAATDTLVVSGFASPPGAGDRYVILYHSGGICTGPGSKLCRDDSWCTTEGVVCDQSVNDDVDQGSRMTIGVFHSEDVELQDLLVSGSTHSGLYVKSSRRVALRDSELFENGGYYGLGVTSSFPSIYLFSGKPTLPCFAGDADCRTSDVTIEGNEIRHGGAGVNPRWDPEPLQEMYIEGMSVYGNHIHDLFNADGQGSMAILCQGKDVSCKQNDIERVQGGIFVSGNANNGWPSETPPVGNLRNAWNVTIEENTVSDVWQARGINTTDAFGIWVAAGSEQVSIVDNSIQRVGLAGVVTGVSPGIRLNGPSRSVDLIENVVADTSGPSLRLAGSGGSFNEPELRPALELSGGDMGVDPEAHVGDPSGFLDVFALERIEIASTAALSIRDERDAGNRGGPGGQDEALYVESLELEPGAVLLNLHELHLYFDQLSGQESQIIDNFCGDSVVKPPEECEDGNFDPGDGCSASCELETEVTVWGAAEGGAVEMTVDGVLVTLPTAGGQTLAEVLAALVQAVQAEPALAGLTTLSIENRLVTTGAIQGFTLNDPGLSDELAVVPAVGLVGLVALGIALVVAGAQRSQLRR